MKRADYELYERFLDRLQPYIVKNSSFTLGKCKFHVLSIKLTCKHVKCKVLQQTGGSSMLNASTFFGKITRGDKVYMSNSSLWTWMGSNLRSSATLVFGFDTQIIEPHAIAPPKRMCLKGCYFLDLGLKNFVVAVFSWVFIIQMAYEYIWVAYRWHMSTWVTCKHILVTHEWHTGDIRVHTNDI